MTAKRRLDARRQIVWGTFDTGKPRVRMLIEALRDIDKDLLVYHRSPWDGIEDKTQVKGAIAKLGILARWLLAYPWLIMAYLRAPAHETVIIPYPGNLDVLVLWPFARIRGARIGWDMFISLYDTAVIDRKMFARTGVAARLLYAFEWLSTRAASFILMDTREHARYIARLYGLAEERVQSVWVGVEDKTFARAPALTPSSVIDVLFYGQFIPLHGIDTIVDAITLIEDSEDAPAMRFVIVGSGQEADRIDRTIAVRGLKSIKRIEWVKYADLPDMIARSSICLGVFAKGGKAARVIPNKVFQILSVGRPLITMDSPAIREILQPGQSARLVKPGDPESLASALCALARELRKPDRAEQIHVSSQSEMIVADVCVVRDQLAKAMAAT